MFRFLFFMKMWVVVDWKVMRVVVRNRVLVLVWLIFWLRVVEYFFSEVVM